MFIFEILLCLCRMKKLLINLEIKKTFVESFEFSNTFSFTFFVCLSFFQVIDFKCDYHNLRKTEAVDWNTFYFLFCFHLVICVSQVNKHKLKLNSLSSSKNLVNACVLILLLVLHR